MFFKEKEPTKPSKEQVEQYGKHIYAILSDSGDITPFDKLVCDSFTYFWMIEKSGQSKFLVANPIAKIDAIKQVQNIIMCFLVITIYFI